MADVEPSQSAQCEQRMLKISMAVSVALSVVALGWGFAAGSQVILLDGIYVILGLGLSWLSLYASRLAAVHPTPRFPFGRESLVPLVVGVQGLALLGTLGYAAVEAIRVILGGGADVAAASLAAYGSVSGLACLAAYGYLVRRGPRSDLVQRSVVGGAPRAGSSRPWPAPDARRPGCCRSGPWPSRLTDHCRLPSSP